MLSVLHPIFVHFPFVLWLICLIAWLTDLKRPEYRWKTSPTVRVLAVAAGLTAALSLFSGLFDEEAARQALQRGWMLDDHRITGIAAAVISLGAASALIAPARAHNIRMLRILALTAALAATGYATWLGHDAVFNGIWRAP